MSFESSETKLQNELTELKKKRQKCIDLINQRQNEYSLNYDTKGEACFDPSTIYIFDEMDKKVQSYQQQEKSQLQIIKEINERETNAKLYLDHLQKNGLELDENPNENIQDQIMNLSKKYNNYLNENIRTKNELTELQKRVNTNLK